MTQEMWGQDIEQVRALADLFEKSAEELESSRQLVDSAVMGFEGWGANVDQMRDEWSYSLAPSLSQIADSLRSAGDKAGQNADAQEGTSNEGGSTGGSPFAGASATGHGESDGGGFFDWVSDGVDNVGDAIGDGVDNVTGAIADGVENVGDAISDGVDNVTDAVSDGVDAVGDGVDWLGDRLSDGADWAGDRVSDGVDAVGDGVDWLGDRASDLGGWLSDRGSAIGDSWGNVSDAAGQYWDATGGAILDGEWPRTTEVIASGVLLNGALLGAQITTLTGGTVEPRIFDDGEPFAGDPTPVNPDNVTIPNGIEDLVVGVDDAYTIEDGGVRITTVDSPEGPRVIVSVPGTEEWNPLAGGNAMDLTGNLVTAGGGESTMTEAVRLAMENANIPPGAEVMMVGHSQGGMTVADLVSDPGFVSEYNVTNAMTYGSPIDSVNLDPRVNVLEVQHQGDLVPRLDLGDARDPIVPGLPPLPGSPYSGPNHSDVTLDNSSPWYDPLGNHAGYDESLKNSNDPAVAAYEQQLIDNGFLGGNDSNTSAVDINVGREH